jgi:hypothetical protein
LRRVRFSAPDVIDECNKNESFDYWCAKAHPT